MEHEPLLDASDAETHLTEAREQNLNAYGNPAAALQLFEYGPLGFVMKDAATELAGDWPAEHFRPDGYNLDAASDFEHHMRASHFYHEQLASEVLVWAHLAAHDWRNGRPTTEETLDRLERALFLLVAERLRVLMDQQQMSVPEQVKRLQEIRLKERGEHKDLRQTRSAQVQGLNRGRVAMAVAAATKKDRARKLAKEFPGKTGGDLLYAIQVAWKVRYPDEKPPSDSSIRRYLAP